MFYLKQSMATLLSALFFLTLPAPSFAGVRTNWFRFNSVPISQNRALPAKMIVQGSEEASIEGQLASQRLSTVFVAIGPTCVAALTLPRMMASVGVGLALFSIAIWEIADRVSTASYFVPPRDFDAVDVLGYEPDLFVPEHGYRLGLSSFEAKVLKTMLRRGYYLTEAGKFYPDNVVFLVNRELAALKITLSGELHQGMVPLPASMELEQNTVRLVP